MAEIQVTTEQLQEAESFLVEFLSENVPEANFGPGSAMRDLAVKAFSYIFAYLKGEVEFSRDRQSLLRISDLTDDQDISQAADEILSNWFINRKDGQYAHITARMHFTQKSSISISADTQFWRTNSLVFYVDTATDPYVIPESELLPVYDTRGQLIDYVVDVPLISSLASAGYNVEPGVFVKVDSPNGLPYFSYAENLSSTNDGRNTESTTEVIARAQTTITVRNLINNRSCDTVLNEAFPAITETLTIGMGEPEMIRDRRTELASHIKLHTGGFYDTYVELGMTTVEETGTVGGLFPRPDNKVVVFRDPKLTYDGPATFVGLGILVGHVLYIRAGIAGSPRGYQIVEVKEHELFVSTELSFQEAYDELVSPTALVYSIGSTYPGFDNILPTRNAEASVAEPNIPVGTSRYIREPGAIVLSGQPVQDIERVEIMDPDASMGNMINPSTGTIIFMNRINHDPVAPVIEPTLTEYRVEVLNPLYSQSADAVVLVKLGFDFPDEEYFTGKTLRVSYKTLSTFRDVSTYVRNRDRRIASANYLVRARHPIWIECRIPYRLRPTAAGAVDETQAALDLADYINNFDPNDDLDMSDLATQFRVLSPNVGTVFPFIIYYHLHAPDGQIADFSTADIVSIFMSSTNGVVLENGADIIAPASFSPVTAIETAENLRSWYDYMGISDRTVRYRTTEKLISFLLRG